jgi:MarR family transcriptional regulator, organic hydroperoxide resistance regulator
MNKVMTEAIFTDADKDYQLWIQFTIARYITFRTREKELQRYNISPENALILEVIHALGEQATPAEISRVILLEPHSVSALLKRMELKGLIIKYKDLRRRNLIRLAITEKGQVAFDYASKRGPIHRIMNSLDDNERQQFSAVLDKIILQAKHELGMDRDEYPSSD